MADNNLEYADLEGKCVLVTGASGGIGSAIALHLARHGVVVGLQYRRHTDMFQHLMTEIQRYSPQSVSLQVDLTDWQATERLVGRFVEQVGKIDGLVNNAGAIWAYGDAQDLMEGDWDKTYALNARAPFELMRGAWGYFVNNAGGRMINISSASVGYHGSLRSVHYISAKAALESISSIFAKDGAKHNILVNTIRLGLMNTPMHLRTPGYTQAHLEARAKLVPLQRMGEPQEVANMVAFLLSKRGDFITGQTIAIAGGD